MSCDYPITAHKLLVRKSSLWILKIYKTPLVARVSNPWIISSSDQSALATLSNRVVDHLSSSVLCLNPRNLGVQRVAITVCRHFAKPTSLAVLQIAQIAG